MMRARNHIRTADPAADFRRLKALLQLFVALWMLAAPTVVTAGEHHGGDPAAQSHHTDGSSCPDGDTHSPCSDDCPCLCCPGHRTVSTVPAEVGLFIEVHCAALPPFFVPACAPNGISAQVFRPPRSI